MPRSQTSEPPVPDQPEVTQWRSCGGFDTRYRNSETLSVRRNKVVDTFAENWRRRERGQQVEMVMFRG